MSSTIPSETCNTHQAEASQASNTSSGNPWNLSPGIYARPDGTPVYVGGREDFQKQFNASTPMKWNARQAQSKVQQPKEKRDK
ncbi:hypothetical protein K505DRAFT_363017 [Melanomma pulvis-pyrius CBS 109.77]|uniref:Uncharacterized protein n=1 Tax=Melanomma pulvis-pyrius CBS 109.77 TaxID=1314802 RepID=A0A6A6X7U6_9PLEO|nr:hypothetical protein K505DRAFT_363017 [Melanomma pulvis-pyrius CBS 109.77]